MHDRNREGKSQPLDLGGSSRWGWKVQVNIGSNDPLPNGSLAESLLMINYTPENSTEITTSRRMNF